VAHKVDAVMVLVELDIVDEIHLIKDFDERDFDQVGITESIILVISSPRLFVVSAPGTMHLFELHTICICQALYAIVALLG
jgi:hypothetical protein